MFGFGGGSKPADTGAAPTREQRKQCWETRDAYYACLDRNEIIQPGDGALSDVKGVCADFRKAYEASCTNSWVDYFNKRRILEIRSAKTIEAANAQGAGRTRQK